LDLLQPWNKGQPGYAARETGTPGPEEKNKELG